MNQIQSTKSLFYKTLRTLKLIIILTFGLAACNAKKQSNSKVTNAIHCTTDQKQLTLNQPTKFSIDCNLDQELEGQGNFHIVYNPKLLQVASSNSVSKTLAIASSNSASNHQDTTQLSMQIPSDLDFSISLQITGLQTGQAKLQLKLYNLESHFNFKVVKLDKKPVEQEDSNTQENQVKYKKLFKQVSAGFYHSLLLKEDGTLWAWGSNRKGQLGIGHQSILQTDTPTQVGRDKWKFIRAGAISSFGIKEDGTLWAWGHNYRSQLGIKPNFERYIPEQVGTDNDWKFIQTGITHTLAIKEDGTLWAWGSNNAGQLGVPDGSKGLVNSQRWSNFYSKFRSESIAKTPIQVGVGTWKTVEGGGLYSVGIKSDGTLWTWGYSAFGALGDGSEDKQKAPQQIGKDTWKSIAASLSSSHVIAIKSDGTLWGWGYNRNGALGDGTKTHKTRPVQISNQTWKLNTSSHAIRSDGTLWGWGYNHYGEIGDGTKIPHQIRPVQVGTKTWVTISTGYFHNIAIRSDSTLWTWGSNNHSQLGGKGKGINHK